MSNRGIGRGRGRLNFTSNSPINETNNDSNPLYDQCPVSRRDIAASDFSDDGQFARRRDYPPGSPLLQGDPEADLYRGLAQGERYDVTCDVGVRPSDYQITSQWFRQD